MALILNSSNVTEYLKQQNLYSEEDDDLALIELKPGKNFNLLLELKEDRKYLVKQERFNQEGKSTGELDHEWRLQTFIKKFNELESLSDILPELLHFDADNAVVIFKYLDHYLDLMKFYDEDKKFPDIIASSLGTSLASIHKSTLKNERYLNFFIKSQKNLSTNPVSTLIQELECFGPEIFGLVPLEGLKFFTLYQRHPNLKKTLQDLSHQFTPMCLTHNDLKLNNILLLENWHYPNDSIVRLIDWERSSWGDPALDLGMLIASYLQIWLSSLIISKSIAIEESLRLAVIPLEQLQPSISALTKAYLTQFPGIFEFHPNFLQCVVQYSGFTLIQRILTMIKYQKSFDNTEIATLQVAMSLLCRTEESMLNIFGMTSAELANVMPAIVLV